MCVSWLVSAQCVNLVGLCVRKNARCMLVWRQRNKKEIDCLCEELSGFYGAEAVQRLYDYATADAFSFLFIRLDAATRRDVFWLRFESRLVVSKDDDERHGVVVDGVGEAQPRPKPGPLPVGGAKPGDDGPHP